MESAAAKSSLGRMFAREGEAVRLLGRGVYQCTMCNQVVRTAHSDALPVIAFTGPGERAERTVTVRGVEVHRCALTDRRRLDVVTRGSTAWIERARCAESDHPETWFPEESQSGMFGLPRPSTLSRPRHRQPHRPWNLGWAIPQ
jgi:hypothetical protein